jgi:hypothetical protein
MNYIELAKQAGFERLGHTDNDWVCYPEDIEAFGKLVEEHTRRAWAKEFAGLGEWQCVNIIEDRNHNP